MNQMTLGDFTAALEASPSSHPIYFDWGGTHPTKFDSYRGYYEQLALGFSADRYSTLSVDDLAKHARGAIGATFTGWKGGDFVMGEDTPLWVANPGNTSNTVIVGVKDTGWSLIIQTQAEFEQ